MSGVSKLFKNVSADAKCHGKETSMWFPHHDRGSRREELNQEKIKTQIAVAICRTCELKDDCLDYSLVNEPYGIWGGKTELQRAAIRVERNIVLFRDGTIFVPGLGNRSANGEARALQPRSFLRRSEIKDAD